MSIPVRLILYFVPMLLSLTVHESSHALSAHFLGDDTAKEKGRITLNPIPHIDLFGTLLLPALAIISNWPVFGWAKPTPVNAARFRADINPRVGMALTSVMGPISNLLLGLLAALLLLALRHMNAAPEWVEALMLATMAVNAALAVFNLLPVPPLDGSNVLLVALPRRAALAYLRIGRWSLVLLLLLFVVPGVSRALAAPMQALLGVYERVAAL